MIFVDPLIGWGQAPAPGAERYFGNGKPSCHMTTDGNVEELNLFAERIGLRTAWLQDRRSFPHYDLTPSKRALAVRNGAKEISLGDMGELIMRHAEKAKDGPPQK